MERRDAKPYVLCAAAALGLAVFGNDTLCFFKNIYGAPCPGCGLTRAYLSLVRGEFFLALRYHPLFALAPVVLVVWAFRDRRPFDRFYRSDRFWIAIIVALLATWVVRMVLYFPDVPPMDLNRSALFMRIFDAVR